MMSFNLSTLELNTMFKLSLLNLTLHLEYGVSLKLSDALYITLILSLMKLDISFTLSPAELGIMFQIVSHGTLQLVHAKCL